MAHTRTRLLELELSWRYLRVLVFGCEVACESEIEIEHSSTAYAILLYPIFSG